MIHRQTLIVLIAAVCGFLVGGFLKPERNLQAKQRAKSGNTVTLPCVPSASIPVTSTGVGPTNKLAILCNGGNAEWTVDPSVYDIHISFSASPFEPGNVAGDYYAGGDYVKNPNGTGKRPAQSSNSTQWYYYTVYIKSSKGGNWTPIDPIVIVGGMGLDG